MKSCRTIFWCAEVIHHIVSAEVHRLARELLDPEPEKAGAAGEAAGGSFG